MAQRKAAPLAGVVMGSDSDWEIMRHAVAQLDAFGIPNEPRVVSAHRMPDDMFEYAEDAGPRGLRVIIAGAGMAAHLAGAVAAHTTLPVIGVPLASGALGGRDALYSTVQMPSGVPVATVAIDGAENAAYLAAQILAVADDALAARLDADRDERRRKLLQG